MIGVTFARCARSIADQVAEGEKQDPSKDRMGSLSDCIKLQMVDNSHTAAPVRNWD